MLASEAVGTFQSVPTQYPCKKLNENHPLEAPVHTLNVKYKENQLKMSVIIALCRQPIERRHISTSRLEY
jgi:hypothetical protein